MSSIVIQGDTSGSITVEAPSVAGTHTLTLPKATGNIATDATVGLGMKNRIINGDMRIHQRGGTITAASATVYYSLDRFWGFAGTGQFSMEQSTDAPDNFLNSMKVTVTTVDSSMAASDRYMLSQPIEGLNVTDLDFGSATAKTVTLSFWVKSSITGTFGVVLINGNATRTYVKEYTINSANTWEKKIVTISGDTTGTWTYTNALWGSVRFCLATGSDYYGTDSTWNGANDISTSNQVNLMATSGATFYITGVQLEIGDTATPFENRMYSTELALCQRYFYKTNETNTTGCGGLNGSMYGSAALSFATNHPVVMRAAPTLTRGGSSDTMYVPNVNGAMSFTITTSNISANAAWFQASGSGGGVGYPCHYRGQASWSAEL